MTRHLQDLIENAIRENPAKVRAALDRGWFRLAMQDLRLATLDVANAVEEAADRLDEIFA
jgi:hypothetical protein